MMYNKHTRDACNIRVYDQHGGADMNSITKKCKKCGETKPLSEFSSHKRTADGLDYWCKSCKTAEAARWQFKNRERYNEGVRERRKGYDPEKRHAKHLRIKFGMTSEQYQNIYNSQGGKCAICGREEKVLSTAVFNKAPKKLSVDHDHKTGQVRGLLCSNCNAAVGYFDDNTSIIEKAIEYLKRWDR